MLHQIKAPQFYTDLGLQKTVMNPLANGKIQGLFKAFQCFSSTFQGKFYFQGLFKTVLYIKVLFKPVRTLVYNKGPEQNAHSGRVIYAYMVCLGLFVRY